MIPLDLEQLEKRLREAAAGRRYREVSRLAPEFAKAVAFYVRALPKGDPRATAAELKLDETVAWSLVRLKAARAACLFELRRVTTANRYSSGYREPGSRGGVQVEA
jgi:hypothetical protein